MTDNLKPDTESQDVGGADAPLTPEQARIQEAERFAAAEAILGTQPIPEQPAMEPLNIAPPPPPGQAQVDDFAQRMENVAEQAQAKAPPARDHTVGEKPVDAPRKSRAEVAALRAAEAEANTVPYWLPDTKEWAKVRDLPFADWVMIQGIPPALREEIDKIRDDENMKRAARGEREITSFVEVAATMDKAITMANGVCIAAFVSPRLVMTEAELDANNPDIWLVSDLTVEERTEFLHWAQRNRAAVNAEAGAGASVSAGFPGQTVAATGDSGESDQVRQATP